MSSGKVPPLFHFLASAFPTELTSIQNLVFHSLAFFFFFLIFIYLFIWLHRVLVAARMWDLVPRPGIEPRPPALEAWSLNHCATREVPIPLLFKTVLSSMCVCPRDKVSNFAFCFLSFIEMVFHAVFWDIFPP